MIQGKSKFAGFHKKPTKLDFSLIWKKKSKVPSSEYGLSSQKTSILLKTEGFGLKSLLFWLRFSINIFRKYPVRFTTLLIFLAIVAIITKNLISLLPIFSNDFVIGVVGEYNVNNLPRSITQLYTQGMTKFDNSGQILPDLAKAWETTDGKKFIFTLNDNLSWQDGKKLEASDIKFQIPNAQVKILDEKNIEFTLTDIYSPYPATLAKPVFRGNSQVGTGPYQIAKVTKAGEILKQIILTPVENLDLPEITIRFFPNSAAAVTSYKTGKLGMILNLMRLNGLENWKGAQIDKILDSTRVVAFFYNTKDDLLKNEKLRKALDLSIDRSQFSNQTAGPYPTSSWVAAKTEPIFDLKKAEKIIKDEKITGGKITILTPPTFENVAQQIAANWQGLGFEVEIKKIDKIPTDFQVAIFGLEIPVDPDQYSFWHSTQSQTLTKIEDPKIDKLLEDGRKLLKPEERKAKYYELQKELRNLVPASFLFFPDRYIVINKNSQKKIDQIKNLFPDFPINY